MSADTFFDDVEIERDGRGAPLIRPAGAAEDVRVPYTRASYLASYITFNEHIVKWKMRYLCRAMGMYEDLAGLAAIETYSTGFDQTHAHEKTASGRRLDAIIERALDRVGISEKADYGTLVHGLTEPGNEAPVPDRAKADVDAFQETVKAHGIKILATEVFTANDETKSAGTFDHLIWHPEHGVVIADKKTGGMHPHEFGVQLSTYANGDVYDQRTHERSPLFEIPPQHGLPDQINPFVGIIFAIKDGKCRVLELDLWQGWAGAKAAAAARDYNESTMKLVASSKKAADALRSNLLKRVSVAATSDELNEIWRENQHLWTDELTTAGRQALAHG